MDRDVGFDTTSREVKHDFFLTIKLVSSLWWTILWALDENIYKARILATVWRIVDIQQTLTYRMNTWNYQTFALHSSVICLGASIW